MRSSIMEVSVDNFKHNINSIQKKIGNDCKIMPVIKANAYGTELNTRIDLLEQFDIVGVAIVDEGINLRKLGFKKEILIINPCFVDELDDAIENNLTISISDYDFIKKLGEKNKKVKVHLEIETGMSRTGMKLENVAEIVELVKKYENIEIEGIYTHMSSAGIDKEYTKMQIESFNKAVEMVKKQNINLKYIHMSASDGTIFFPEAHYNLVRPGIILYGYESTEGVSNEIDIKPVCKLKSKITFLKTVEAGTSIGYSRTYITDKKTKVATIPIGYADGLKRCLSNKGKVYINGILVPIIGNVCMDGFMADVTNVPDVKVGDNVWIWDNVNTTVYDIAEKCGTCDYEILTSISGRIPRIFV